MTNRTHCTARGREGSHHGTWEAQRHGLREKWIMRTVVEREPWLWGDGTGAGAYRGSQKANHSPDTNWENKRGWVLCILKPAGLKDWSFRVRRVASIEP